MDNIVPFMTDNHLRLRCLELALEHGLSTDKIAVAKEFEAFVFARQAPVQSST